MTMNNELNLVSYWVMMMLNCWWW